MKAITPVIAIVLLLMVTIAIVGFSFTFLSSMFAGTAETTSQQIEQQLGAMSSCMQIDSISFDKVYVRNCGSGSLYNFSVYVDGESIAVTNSPVVAENAAGELALAKGVSGDAIKVTSPSAQVQATLKHCNIDKLLPVNLVGYWMLDNDSAVDYSGQGNKGTYYGGVNCSADGKFGKACKFDGINDYVLLGQPVAIANLSEASLSLWYNRLSHIAAYQMLFTDQQSSFEMTINGANTLVFYINNSGISYNSAADMGVWYHAVGTSSASGNSQKLYVNGILVASSTYKGTTGSGYPRLIGSRSGSLGFNGTIDDIAIWNRALSQDDVRKLYTAIC